MKYLSYITKSLIRYVCILSISIVWINYFVRKFSIALTLSILLATGVEIIMYWLYYRSIKNKQLTNANTAKQLALHNYMLYTALPSQLLYYANILKQTYCSQIYKDCIVAIFDNKKVCYIPKYSIDSINVMAVIECIRIGLRHKADKIIVLTNEICSHAKQYIDNAHGMEIEIYNLSKTINLIIGNQSIPDCPITISKNKPTFRQYAGIIFTRAHAKGYLMSGIIIMLSSLIVPYSIYYIIMGTIMLLFALICLQKKSE